MRIKTGTVKDGHAIDVELTDQDGELQWGDAWAGFPVQERFKRLTKLGDVLLVSYLLADGHISKEFADQRMREIKAR